MFVGDIERIFMYNPMIPHEIQEFSLSFTIRKYIAGVLLFNMNRSVAS